MTAGSTASNEFKQGNPRVARVFLCFKLILHPVHATNRRALATRPGALSGSQSKAPGSAGGYLLYKIESEFRSIASRISCCVSSFVLPVVTTPGKSGRWLQSDLGRDPRPG